MLFAEPRQPGVIRIAISRALRSIPLAAMSAVIELFPEDTEFVGTINEPHTMTMYVFLRSRCFPAIEDGGLVPEVDLIFTEGWDEQKKKSYYKVKFAEGSFEDGLQAAVRRMELASFKRQP